jgi:hypothetical protein
LLTENISHWREKDPLLSKTFIGIQKRAVVVQSQPGAHTGTKNVMMMIVLLLFLQKQSLAFAVYLFGIGTLHTGPGLKKKKHM